MTESIMGRVHSIQSMGALDGPGIRFVVFAQGCPLRCGCCHNPDTWAVDGGKQYSASELAYKAARYKDYFGKDGGVTVSGGEPLLQPEFVREFFRISHELCMNTCLDTSGCILNDSVMALLKETDRVLLDIKYVTDALYRKHVGCSITPVMEFLDWLDENSIPTTIRQVTIPGLNADEASVRALKQIADAHHCVDSIELLPFKKLCQIKYDNMGIEFPFAGIDQPDRDTMDKLNSIIKSA